MNGPGKLQIYGLRSHGSYWKIANGFGADGIYDRHRVKEIKTVANVPLSHPFVERVIGTTRREFLDQTLFWNARDLERKLGEFKEYYNKDRVHGALGGDTPAKASGELATKRADRCRFRWKTHCRGLVALPMAA